MHTLKTHIGNAHRHQRSLDRLAQTLDDRLDMPLVDDERRRELRSILRRRLENSTLLDHAGFTRKLEQVYRDAIVAAGA